MLETGSICQGHGCTAGILEGAAGLFVSPILPGRQMSQQDKERGCYNSANCTFVDSTDLVPVSVGGTGRLSNPSASEERLAERPIRKGSSNGISRQTSFSRVEGIRDCLRTEGISEDTSSQVHGAEAQMQLINQHRLAGNAGVCQGTWIPIRVMSNSLSIS